jgi:hypothetical protein
MGLMSNLLPALMNSPQIKQLNAQQAPSNQGAPVAQAVGPLQGSGVAVASGTPAKITSGGGFSPIGVASLLNNPQIRAQLNLSNAPAEQQATPVQEQPKQPTIQELYLSSPEYQAGLNSFAQRLSSVPVTPQQAYRDIYQGMVRDSNKLNPFQRRP